MTHYCWWDTVGRGVVLALCGALIRRVDHADAPTCPACAKRLRLARHGGDFVPFEVRG